MRLHTFEKTAPSEMLRRRLQEQGVSWSIHPFGTLGTAGGLGRVARAAVAVRGAQLLHARSALPAAATLLARPRAWVWDMRGFWSDERIELGTLRQGSVVERAVRAIERRAALSAGVIITLAAAAVPVINERYGDAVGRRARAIPTCVDLERFAVSEFPATPVRLLISGTLNNRYDVDGMLRLGSCLGRHLPVRVQVLCPDRIPFRSGVSSGWCRCRRG